MQRINFTFPDETARELRRKVSVRSRSKFVVEAVKDKLGRKNLKKEYIKSLKAQREIVREIQEDFKYVDAEAFDKLP